MMLIIGTIIAARAGQMLVVKMSWDLIQNSYAAWRRRKRRRQHTLSKVPDFAKYKSPDLHHNYWNLLVIRMSLEELHYEVCNIKDEFSVMGVSNEANILKSRNNQSSNNDEDDQKSFTTAIKIANTTTTRATSTTAR